MKYIASALIILFWCLFTLALVVTIIGVFVILVLTEEDGYWEIPKKAIKVFET